MSSPTIIGNFRIVQHARTVAIRLVTDANGCAIFGYEELPALAEYLKGLSPPGGRPAKPAKVEDEWEDLI